MSFAKNVLSLCAIFATFSMCLVGCGDSSSSVDDSEYSSSSISDDDPLSSSSVVVAQVCDTCKTAWDFMNPDIEYGELVDERDGQVYRTVEIGGRVWMAQNLNYDYGLITADDDTLSSCLNNSLDSCAKYGRRYMWAAAMDSAAFFSEDASGCGYGIACKLDVKQVRGICPEGWHIPLKEDWKNLGLVVGDSSIRKLKTTTGWGDYLVKDSTGESIRYDGNGTDDFGFGLLPLGEIVFASVYRKEAAFWTPSNDEKMVSGVYIQASDIEGPFAGSFWTGKRSEYPVRCMKDYDDFPFTGVDPSGVRTGSLKDERDGQYYKTITIDGQTWMAENLNYAYLEPTSKLDSSSFCYGDDSKNCDLYGRLYLWSAVIDSAGTFSKAGMGCGMMKECDAAADDSEDLIQGVCPKGWHVPKDSEWNKLFDAVGGKSLSGVNLKSTEWNYSAGTDEYGFSALPAGKRDMSNSYVENGKVTAFWSASEFTERIASQWQLDGYDYVTLMRDGKNTAVSVRCLKD